MSCVPTGPYRELAVHPAGESIAILCDDLTVELWCSRGEAYRYPGGSTERDGWTDGTSRGQGIADDGRCAGWLQFTADGSYLLFGEARPDGPVRLNLLDVRTLTRIGTVPLETWGEGVEVACAPAPSTAVAFAACSGDDTVILAVAEVVEGRLRVYGADSRSSSPAADIPGERVTGIAFSPAGELVVLDSDAYVSAVRWRDPVPSRRDLAGGYELLRADVEPRRPFVAGLRALGTDDEELSLGGPMFVRGRTLAAVVERERWIGGDLDWRSVALVFLDIPTGEWLGFLELPGAERDEPILLRDGIVCQSIGERTRVARWLPADRPGGVYLPGDRP
ncbi:hypothetical protein SAMN05444920_12543 [Nonomuraea solani]|uniref:WD40-like Beta Propeller Repeat n=1 Tax=Nonomuraea solani TaxID=1144553 RepID=A0A1H6EZ65_9ACTN|nr:hypothetical protein SAMN05444920_12543 [Nonomuraea solani]